MVQGSEYRLQVFFFFFWGGQDQEYELRVQQDLGSKVFRLSEFAV